MLLEMPERWGDVNPDAGTALPIDLLYGKKLAWPALAKVYGRQLKAAQATYGDATVGQNSHAKCLYMIVAANPEDLEQFSRSEIDIPDGDGLPVFVDGWGKPICFLRWAPAFSSWEGVSAPPSPAMPSDIQTGNPVDDHDPFDARGVDPAAYKLMPLIYSAGGDKHRGINTGQDVHYNGRIFTDPEYMAHGAPLVDDGLTNTHFDNINNHHIEQR
jgi:hypothetical protein